MRKFTILFFSFFIIVPVFAIDFPGEIPRKSSIKLDNNIIIAKNSLLNAKFKVSKNQIAPISFYNIITDKNYNLSKSKLFEVETEENIYSPKNLKLTEKIKIYKTIGNSNSHILSEKESGFVAKAIWIDNNNNFKITWHLILKEHSSYLRQIINIEILKDDIRIKNIKGWEIPSENGYVVGSVDGVPIADENIFYSCEMPMSIMSVENSKMIAVFPRAVKFKKGEYLNCSFVTGIISKSKLRKSFNYYLERERATSYRPFLHYNAWFDLCWNDAKSRKMTEKKFIERIETIGEELSTKRGVKIDGFVADDGWDDLSNLWGFNSKFPNGFNPHKKVAEKYNAVLGAWVSPWGGYGWQKKKRIEAGKLKGYEVNEKGFSLAGNFYKKRFFDICLNMIRKYNIKYFKFDGVGNGNGTAGADKFEKDIDGLLSVIKDLRKEEPELFINATVGTWPSPFWLKYADSIWRSGQDSNFSFSRENWITYRDGEIYKNIVKRSPLFPISSVMSHGILLAQYGNPSFYDRFDSHFKNEVRSYFATGYNLRELYITPSLLSKKKWDYLAEAARWAEEYSDIMSDTHWIGGDPYSKDIYGWAAYEKRKGYIALRNPNKFEKEISLDLKEVFDFTDEDSKVFKTIILKDAYSSYQIKIDSAEKYSFKLKAFEVLVLNLEDSSSL